MLIAIVLAVVAWIIVVWRAASASMASKPPRASSPVEPLADVTVDIELDTRMAAISAELDRNRPILAAAHEARVMRGRDISEWRHDVQRLKAEGRLEEALALAYECSDAQERWQSIYSQATVDGRPFARGSYWSKDIAIILRKMKDFDAEVRYLEEKLDADPENMEINSRLSKARLLAAKDAAL